MKALLSHISKEYNRCIIVLLSLHFYCQYRLRWLNCSILDKLNKDVLNLLRYVFSLLIYKEKHKINKKICLNTCISTRIAYLCSDGW